MDSKIDPLLFGLPRTADVKSVTTLPTAAAGLKGTIFHRTTDNTFWNVADDGLTWESAAAQARAAVGAQSATKALPPGATVAVDWTPATPDLSLTLDQATEISKGSGWPTTNSGSTAMRLHFDRTASLYALDITTSLCDRVDVDLYPSNSRYATLLLTVENGVVVGSYGPGRVS